MSEGETHAVIGATGFIGRRIARSLRDGGFKVRAVVRPHSRRQGAVPAGCEVHKVDLAADPEKLDAILAPAATVILAAGSVRGCGREDFYPANVDAVEAVARSLQRQCRGQRLLLLSSLAAREPHLSPYAESKREGERVLERFPDLQWTIIRPPAVYGPGDRELAPLFRLIRKGFVPVMGPAGQRLSLVHVDDLASAVTAWITATEAGSSGMRHTFELHDGKTGGYSIDEIVEAAAPHRSRVLRCPVPASALFALAWLNRCLAGLAGKRPMLTPGKVRELRHPAWVCDNSALSALTGWQPTVSLREGVAALLEGAPASPDPKISRGSGESDKPRR